LEESVTDLIEAIHSEEFRDYLKEIIEDID